jgi:hypothetical protein
MSISREVDESLRCMNNSIGTTSSNPPCVSHLALVLQYTAESTEQKDVESSTVYLYTPDFLVLQQCTALNQCMVTHTCTKFSIAVET